MGCPRCGYDILDPDPRFCPRCGYEFGQPSGQATPSATIIPGVTAPQGNAAPAPSRGEETADDGIKRGYYLLALLTVVGGVIGYRAARRHNPRVAATILTISLIVTLVYIGAGYGAYSAFKGPSGVPDLVITSVSFPNSSAVQVTVVNEGTAHDGLESVAINNGTLWLVYGLLSPNSPQASSEIQAGDLQFSLYGYILGNGTDVAARNQQSATVGTEGFPPGHSDQVVVPFGWTPATNYTVFISTSSRHPDELSVTSPSPG
jgi:hypothetical protein